MKTQTTITSLREALSDDRINGRSIAFVPTLGNLHDGHMALVNAAKKSADVVVVSVFVNPMQFGPNEDLDAYPRTLAADKEKLLDADVDYLFAPSARDMYPQGINTQIVIPVLSNILCGASRPGHFTGVATICAKLFNIVQPDIAIFGKKDFQQLTIIKHMVDDLLIPVKIIGVETGRAPDGLALSSRNQYLAKPEREVAAEMYRALVKVRDAITAGDRNFYQLTQQAIQQIESVGFRSDYFRILNRHTLEQPTPADKELVILAAAQLGKARLIDNLEVEI